jgi:tRNA(Ile2) C34 agmatinyltransferase TiaS
MRKKYPSATSKPVRFTLGGGNDLKANYRLERRVIEQYRTGRTSYETARSLDVDYEDVPELRAVTNWDKIYNKIKATLDTDPVLYVRHLFFFLRGSSSEIPTPAQLSSAKFMQLYQYELKDAGIRVYGECRAEADRAESEILLLQQQTGQPMAVAVNSVTSNPSLGLSPLFCFQLFKSLDEDPRVAEEHRKMIKEGVNRYEARARRDYSLFPEVYKNFYGKGIELLMRD